VQRLLFSPQTWSGVTQPVVAAQDFVIQPLTALARTDPAAAAPLATYRAASPAQQLKWANAYATAETKATFVAGNPVVPKADDGPVPAMMADELTLARSGALDADLLAQQPFYGTNFTKPLLFIEDGQYFVSQATAMNLSGSQWGVMNETGSYPGQPWLWLWLLWYQVPGWTNSANIDMIAIYMTGLATILLLLVPFLPGLRDIPCEIETLPCSVATAESGCWSANVIDHGGRWISCRTTAFLARARCSRSLRTSTTAP
jgi:hypothetical protein